MIREVKDLDKPGKSNSLYPHKPNGLARPLLHHFYSQHPHHAHLLCTVSAENHLTQSPPLPLSVSTINLSSSLSNPTKNGSRHLHNVYRKALVAEIDCKAGNDDNGGAAACRWSNLRTVDQRRQALPTKCTTASRIKMCQERHSFYWSPDQINSRGC